MTPIMANPQALTDNERAQFEAWIARDSGDLSTFGSGQNVHYRNNAVNNAWTGWQAARATTAAASVDNPWKNAVIDALSTWPGLDFPIDTPPQVILDAVLAIERSASVELSGWQLVPIEPTEAMIDAAINSSNEWPRGMTDFGSTYRAMLAASPKGPL